MAEFLERDFETIKAKMLSDIPTLAPSWTNLNEGDLGIALVNLIAGTADMLSYYLDRNALEVFLPTAVTREAVQRLAKLIDYRMRRATAAITKLRFTVPTALGTNLTIPAQTVVKTNAGVYFATKRDAVLVAGQTQVDIEAYQGKLVSDSFTGTGRDEQTYALTRPNVAQNFLVVKVGGTEWVEDTREVQPELTGVYEVLTNDAEVASIRFSVYFDAVPEQNTNISAVYLETLGAQGNIGVGLVNSIVSVIPSAPVGITVTNITTAVGGKTRESIEETKDAAPRYLRTLNRAVTLKDHEDLLELYPGIAKAQALNHSGYVEIYVAPDGGGLFYVKRPAIALAADAAASTLTNVLHYVRVTSLDSYGETTSFEYNPSDKAVLDNVATFTPTASQSIKVTITNTPGATGYNIYLGTSDATTKKLVTVPAALGATTVVILSALPPGGNPLPPSRNTTGPRSADSVTSLRVAAEDYLEPKRLVGATYALFNPTYVPINITATITIFDNYYQSAVRADVETALAKLFAFEDRAFGDDVSLASIYSTVMQVPGVKTLALVSPSSDTAIGNGEIAALGTLSNTMVGGTTT